MSLNLQRGLYLRLRTPEGVEFSLPLANPFMRFVAWLIDCMAIAASILLLAALAGVLGIVSFDVAGAFVTFAAFVVAVGYGMTLEWVWRGQTIGKRIMRLRVIDAQGLRLRFSQVVVRNLLRPVDMLPKMYLVGGIACFVSRLGQRLGDLAANTVVIRLPTPLAYDPTQVLGGKYNSFRAHPHLIGRLRQSIGPLDAQLALQALQRREQLDPAARLQVYRELAAHFRALVAFPDDATLGLSDEQYLRNCVDVIYTQRAAVTPAATTAVAP